jgi:hypothetical protein
MLDADGVNTPIHACLFEKKPRSTRAGVFHALGFFMPSVFAELMH